MKKYAYIALCLVLTASVLAGCGCTNQNMETKPEPTILPTNEEVWDTTERPIPNTTQPSITTHPSETTDRGNGPLEDLPTDTTQASTATDPSETTGAAEGRSRRMMPGIQ
ncbi:MAG: hypothetical protein IKB09_01320 [Oscillospiraceae bacterium]|nr:hypothetical protein [Oscillospiraceae bacterium]